MMKVMRLCCCAVIGLSTLGVTYANDLSSPVTLTKSQLNNISERYKLQTVTNINGIGCVAAYIGSGNLWHFVNRCPNTMIQFRYLMQSNSNQFGGTPYLKPFQEMYLRNHPYPTWGLVSLDDWRV
jgi:hypothetical protein